MTTKKIVFIAFPIEDVALRDFLKGHSLHPQSTYEFIDMSVHEAYATGWKEKVEARINRSHGVIAIITKNSTASTGQNWEIDCAKRLKKPILAIWGYQDDKTAVTGLDAIAWTWDAVTKFIDRI